MPRDQTVCADDPLVIAGRAFRSRLRGTGKFSGPGAWIGRGVIRTVEGD
jgi:hypothetical protein